MEVSAEEYGVRRNENSSVDPLLKASTGTPHRKSQGGGGEERKKLISNKG